MIVYNNAEFEIDGVKRGFRLGTSTFKAIKQLTGFSTKEDLTEKVVEGDHEAVLALFYCCAVHWHKSNNRDIDFNEYIVGDWMDFLGEEKVKEITNELFRVRESKNAAAPETGQNQILMSMNGTH